jgi:hypothetical protein
LHYRWSIAISQLREALMDKKGWFDAGAFYESLDAARQARRLNWKQVAAESGDPRPIRSPRSPPTFAAIGT